MTQQTRIRYKPDVMIDKTIVANAAPDGSTGTLYLEAQAVAYDDAIVTQANYAPGNPATEANLTVVYQDVLQFDLAAFAGKSSAQVNAILDAALDAWATANKPLATAVAPIRRAAMTRPPRAVP